MEIIKMPDSCREKIISHQLVTTQKKHCKSYRKAVFSLAAAVICFSMIGGAAVYAYQKDMLGYLFRADINKQNEQIIENYDGIITDFSAELNDFTADIVASFGNENFLSFVVAVTPNTDTDMSKYSDLGNYALMMSDTIVNSAESRFEKSDDGLLYIYYKFDFDEPVADKTDFNIPVSLWSMTDNYSRIELGNINFSIDLSAKQKSKLYKTNEKIDSAARAIATDITISPLFINISGTARNDPSSYPSNYLSDDLSVALWYKDGHSEVYNAKTSGFGTHSCFDMSNGMYNWDISFDTGAVIDPESVQAVEINDYKIKIQTD